MTLAIMETFSTGSVATGRSNDLLDLVVYYTNMSLLCGR